MSSSRKVEPSSAPASGAPADQDPEDTSSTVTLRTQQDVAVEVASLGKMYRMYDCPADRLRQMLWGRHLKNGYGKEFWALKDISFSIRKGECLGIIGRNGSGKSSLLQLICGTLSPSTGAVHTSGRIAALLELGSGFNPEFTGRQNVYLNGSILGLRTDEIAEKFTSIVDFADIGQFLDQPVKTYSSGMVVRLAFAVAMHVDPDILIIDEALSVGDVFFVQKCMRALRKLMETKTVLFVSHDTAAVVNFCNRAILLEGGRLKMLDSPKAVAQQYLQDLHAERTGTTAATSSAPKPKAKAISGDYRDARADMINGSALRNDLEVFRFRPDSNHFGKGLMTIDAVHLVDEDGTPLSWTVGGELVRLRVRCRTLEAITRPIVGFQLKDRLGQYLFGDNTYLSHRDAPRPMSAAAAFEACFEFRMPILPAGDFCFAIAAADGTQEHHTQHHWLHDALTIKSHVSSNVFGLVGIPMKSITLEVL